MGRTSLGGSNVSPYTSYSIRSMPRKIFLYADHYHKSLKQLFIKPILIDVIECSDMNQLEYNLAQYNDGNYHMVIIPSTTAEENLSRITDYKQVHSILIYCDGNTKYYKDWVRKNNYKKIRDVFLNKDLRYKLIMASLHYCEFNERSTAEKENLRKVLNEYFEDKLGKSLSPQESVEETTDD
ncbi:unnamed protein product [Didymodactylos carnosus]|uniref:Uncharacterized protein n=1 Tax=Didymodactylos carnosus TaxID=1234261 RepID=A0A8S2HX73_9BILA|nr:unnamed protein product [Didymodactylos carnosus]CAF3670161.1 unnamed protein product [Didymodactylos carnosus]